MLLNEVKAISLKKNISLIFSSNIVSAICKWGIIVSLTKLIGVESVGIYSFGLAIVTPVFMLSNFALRNLQVVDVNDKYSFNEYFSIRFYSSLSSVIICTLISVIIGKPDYLAIISVLSLSKFNESIIDIFNGYEQKNNSFYIISKCLFWRSVVGFIVFIFIILTTNNLIIALLFQLASDVLIFYIIELTDYLKRENIATLIPKLKWASLKLVRLAAPMAIVSLLAALNTNIPRYFIESTEGLYELGIFSSIIYFTVAGNTVVSAIGQTTVSKFAKLYINEDFFTYKKILLKFLLLIGALGLTIIIATIFIGGEILTLFYAKHFQEYTNLFISIMIGGGVLYIASFLGFLQTTIPSLYKKYCLLYLVASFVNIIACYFLIEPYGVYGASFAIIITFIFLSVGSLFLILKNISDNKNKIVVSSELSKKAI